ncbi:hypothetical protein RFI_18147 [Reticulomyxa filosa]|uniref:Uncharacterized protein n=1 Tax=Reticulomyxa filosa TaxID=46433 RepID=X6MZL1_RETFI|nr:hypothetical protein RFI_18147 [Reticulomyxa filosa]|eukprot:ETO19093.1 hypothetical protein RFI_18147 [Reticulomyxa filosa]
MKEHANLKFVSFQKRILFVDFKSKFINCNTYNFKKVFIFMHGTGLMACNILDLEHLFKMFQNIHNICQHISLNIFNLFLSLNLLHSSLEVSIQKNFSMTYFIHFNSLMPEIEQVSTNSNQIFENMKHLLQQIEFEQRNDNNWHCLNIIPSLHIWRMQNGYEISRTVYMLSNANGKNMKFYLIVNIKQ